VSSPSLPHFHPQKLTPFSPLLQPHPLPRPHLLLLPPLPPHLLLMPTPLPLQVRETHILRNWTSRLTRDSANEQTFTGSLGGVAPPVTSSAGDRPFTVNGNTFVNLGAALQRSCAIQNTACSNAANAGTLAGTNVGDCNAQEAACNAAASAKVKRAALDFGSCSNPAIEFAAGLDGRTEDSFEAINQVDFNHGSALNIEVISSFVCQQLQNKCKASAAAIAACTAGETAASKFNLR
jgi:hypothetical protein